MLHPLLVNKTMYSINESKIQDFLYNEDSGLFITPWTEVTSFLLSCRAAYITVMKICKLMLTTVSHAKFQVVVEACSADPQSPNITQAEHSHALILQQALQFIPNPGAEVMTRMVGLRLGQQLLDQVTEFELIYTFHSFKWWHLTFHTLIFWTSELIPTKHKIHLWVKGIHIDLDNNHTHIHCI